MTTGEKWLVALVIVAAAGLCAWWAGMFGVGVETTPTSTAALGISVTASVALPDLAGRPHVVQPSQLDNPIRHRHPLYRRPHMPRPGAYHLMANGWRGWITDPPSEASI